MLLVVSPTRSGLALVLWAFAIYTGLFGGLDGPNPTLAIILAAVGFLFWAFQLDGDDSPWRRFTRPWRQ
jgi:hypothetical protein